MCLSTVKETYDNPSKVIVDGWKNIDASKPRFQLAVNGSLDIPKDKWITATSEHEKSGQGIKADDGIRYEPGFHAYADEKELKGKGHVRVFLRGVSCLGSQDGKQVIIAREMYLPSDPNGWPPKNQTLMDKIKGITPGNA